MLKAVKILPIVPFPEVGSTWCPTCLGAVERWTCLGASGTSFVPVRLPVPNPSRSSSNRRYAATGPTRAEVAHRVATACCSLAVAHRVAIACCAPRGCRPPLSMLPTRHRNEHEPVAPPEPLILFAHSILSPSSRNHPPQRTPFAIVDVATADRRAPQPLRP